jgi:hypothetical protein
MCGFASGRGVPSKEVGDYNRIGDAARLRGIRRFCKWEENLPSKEVEDFIHTKDSWRRRALQLSELLIMISRHYCYCPKSKRRGPDHGNNNVPLTVLLLLLGNR